MKKINLKSLVLVLGGVATISTLPLSIIACNETKDKDNSNGVTTKVSVEAGAKTNSGSN